MKRNITIGTKLFSIVAVMAAAVLALGYFSIHAVNSLEAVYNTTVDRVVRRVILADQLNTAESDMMVGQRGWLLDHEIKKLAQAEIAHRLYGSSAERANKAMAEFRPLIETEEGRQLVNKIEANLTAWQQIFAEMERAVNLGDVAGAAKLGYEKTNPIYLELGQQASRLTEIQKNMMKNNRMAAADLSSTSHWIVMIALAVCMLTTVVLLLTVAQVNRGLRTMARELAEGAVQVASAAQQISSSSQSLSQGSSEQAATLEETSAASEEISSMIDKNAATSREVAQNMHDASKQITIANDSLVVMVGSMKEINASSDKIAKIIKVIDEIAFQTNLLALNAAVEAARAGEAGMGFAVVAEEVRSLAQRCAQAAKDTQSLIEESIQKSRDGKTKLEQVTTAVDSVTASATKVKVLVDELDQASQEQAKGMQQVASAIVTMEQVTQKTAASAEESASAGEELSAQSQTLRDMVERLGALVGTDR